MSDDDLERLLGDSFDRAARAAVPDSARPPRPRFADPVAPARRRSTARWLAPVAAAAVVLGVVVGVVALQDHGTPAPKGTAAQQHSLPGTSSGTSSAATATAPSSASAGAAPVHVKLYNADNSVVGVGMPVIAYFSKTITDAKALSEATTLTVDGTPETGAWYFEKSGARGYPVEGHFRMKGYWPANAKIHVGLPLQGLSGGKDLAFADNLTLDFSTGPSQIVTVDDARHNLVLRRDGRQVETLPVSLGAPSTPTLRGTKVIMEKGRAISMSGPGYYDPHVQWTQRLTYSGEYLHAAPWNVANIDKGIDSSNGCTNLDTNDARRLYAQLRVGDVVQFPDASGPAMTLGDGFGDWNVPWTTWLTGGLVPTS